MDSKININKVSIAFVSQIEASQAVLFLSHSLWIWFLIGFISFGESKKLSCPTHLGLRFTSIWFQLFNLFFITARFGDCFHLSAFWDASFQPYKCFGFNTILTRWPFAFWIPTSCKKSIILYHLDRSPRMYIFSYQICIFYL